MAIKNNKLLGHEIAVIGYAGRFPKCASVDELWEKLCRGEELVTRFTQEELNKERLFDNQQQADNYVPAKGFIAQSDYFDAHFFDLTPAEAELLDPQQRILTEIAWQALEHAGYVKESKHQIFSVFAGCGFNTYLLLHLISKANLPSNAAALYNMILSNEKDMLALRVSYLLDLHGPSMSIQTACSTSLVNIIIACEKLNNNECDLALAGGISLSFPEINGYEYVPGMILSPDGHTRTFDKNAHGTVPANGAGLVVLKRVQDALDDNDTIHGIVTGWGITNDGKNKAFITAPSVKGQAEAIALAQMVAEVNPEDIGYIEAHGTATEMGDPIEVEALNKAFRLKTTKNQYCAIGSIKSNAGHMDAASGVAGFLKALLATKYGKIPPSLHYNKENPNIDFSSSPFYVATELLSWNASFSRIAGVSSFGIGGTNAHVIIEQSLNDASTPSDECPQLLLFSAKTEQALRDYLKLFSTWACHNNAVLADVAFTLQCGRANMAYRTFVTADSLKNLDIPFLEQNIHYLNPNITTAITITLGSLQGTGLENIHLSFEGFPAYQDFYQKIINGSPENKEIAIITSFLYFLSKSGIKPTNWQIDYPILICVLVVHGIIKKDVAVVWIKDYKKTGVLTPIFIQGDIKEPLKNYWIGTEKINFERLNDKSYLSQLALLNTADIKIERHVMHLQFTSEGVYLQADSVNKKIAYDRFFSLGFLGVCWCMGLVAYWDHMPHQGKGHRIPLPTYAFQSRKFSWLHQKKLTNGFIQGSATPSEKSIDIQIKELWCDLLGVESLKEEDEWYSSGGNSIQLIEFMLKLSTQLSIKIEPKDVIGATGFAQLSAMVKQKTTELSAPKSHQNASSKPFTLVNIKKTLQSDQTIFLIHPVGGAVYCYEKMASCLENVSIYGLQAQALDGITDPGVSILQMAKTYINAIKTMYLGQHWILVGYSLGGNIAFTMAELLEKEGYKVSLILIDSFYLKRTGKKISSIYEYGEYVGKHYAFDITAKQFEEMSAAQRLDVIKKLGILNVQIENQPSKQLEKQCELFFKIFLANQEVIETFSPQKINADILYIQAMEHMEYHPENPSATWKQLTSGAFNVAYSPGNHLTLINGPHANALGEIITPYLNKWLVDDWLASLNGIFLRDAKTPYELLKKAKLPSTLDFSNKNKAVVANPVCFLTGATGFLGIYLLVDLLENTNSEIYCLIRAGSLEQARHKLLHNAVKYSEQDKIDFSRIKIILGDLSLPLFGLEKNIFDDLAEKIDRIYHAAALINFFLTYEQLKETNVLGTLEIIRLATHSFKKPVHYVSTLSVFPNINLSEPLNVNEDTDILTASSVALQDGYTQSKWVAEYLMHQAQKKGLSVSIYRPGHMTGSSITGILNPGDYFTNSLLWSLHNNALPEIKQEVDFVPVDYVSASIIYLSLQSGITNKIYHLTNNKGVTIDRYATVLSQYNPNITVLPYYHWISQLIKTNDKVFDCISTFLPLVEWKYLYIHSERSLAILPENILLKLVEPEKLIDLYLTKMCKR